MPMPAENQPAFQAQFHRRWNYLSDPHVRTLAWLLDAPDLLDPAAPEWQGRIASLPRPDGATEEWLLALDANPAALHSTLDIQPLTRLGRYAENLMAYYLSHQDILVAHGVQVRADQGNTIGEFDFLVRQGTDLVHWEFATKLYLLEASGDGRHADYFVGPNLADTLGAKVRKIMDRQLSLAAHPAAQACIPEPVAYAQALVKGWLFYHGATPSSASPDGVTPAHCRGFWRALQDFTRVSNGKIVILPRLAWLAPAKLKPEDAMEYEEFHHAAMLHFSTSSTPVLVALLEEKDGWLLERDRGFVVPDDWRGKAAASVARQR